MTMYRSQPYGHLLATILALLACSSGAFAAGDPVNGKLLFTDESRADGQSCSGCHNLDPTRNQSNVLNGSGKPAVIQHAIDSNIGDMGQLAGLFSSAELADIAAFLSAVPGSSVTSLSFGAPLNGRDARSVALNNAGGLYFRLDGATLEGAGAAAFAVNATACTGLLIGGPQTKAAAAAVSNCQLDVSYQSTSGSSQDAVLVIQGSAVNAKGVALAGEASTLRLHLAGRLSAISLSPNLLSFSNVEEGHSYAGSSSLLNEGGTSVTVNDISASDAGDHVHLASGPGYCNKGDVLEPGQQCLLAVMVSGPAAASVQVETSAGSQALTIQADMKPASATVSSLSSSPPSNDGAGGCAIVGATASFDPVLMLMTAVAGAVSYIRSRRT